MALYLSGKPMQNQLGGTKQIKAKKCQLERIRRQRINDRLEKLKIIVMKQLGNDVGFYPPMEKADILELAIRCLEGKTDNTENDSSSLERDNNERAQRRTPLGQLCENTTPSAETKRELEVTPIRTKSFLTTTLRTELDRTEKMSACIGLGQPRAELKPLLHHPIKSFRKRNRRNVMSRINTPSYDRLSYESSSTLQPPSLIPIWRPWTL